MLDLIKRLSEFGIDVIVSSHVLTDIEQVCSWVVMLDAGDLLVNGPLEEFGQLSTVQVELIGDVVAVADRLTGRGYEVSVAEGQRLVVGGDNAERAIVEAAHDLSAGLVRMVRGTGSLEDLFLDRDDRP